MRADPVREPPEPLRRAPGALATSIAEPPTLSVCASGQVGRLGRRRRLPRPIFSDFSDAAVVDARMKAGVFHMLAHLSLVCTARTPG